jgi:lysozyme
MVPRLAVEVVKRFEGLHKVVRLQPRIEVVPYVCPAGYWTIGYGHLCKRDQPPISEEQADAWCELDLQSSVDSALRLSPVLGSEGEQRLSAIASFIFNLGAGRYQASTLRRRVNERDWTRSGIELRRWVFAGAQKLPGLVVRREVEALMLEAST